MTDKLLWIVPMRRVVVRRECTYRELMSSWHGTLDASKLAQWYWPSMVADLPTYGRPDAPFRADLELAFKPALQVLIEQQKAWLHDVVLPGFSSGSSAPAPRQAVAQPGPNRFRDEDVVLARLWKGPLRTLVDLEQIAAGRTDYDDDVGFDAQYRVTRRDATFVPGDVLELPIFVLLRRAGVVALQGAEFNPKGSFLNGTSVWKRTPGQQPPSVVESRGVVRLHDNLMAMRFQALLNAALCGWYAEGPAFRADSRLDRSCFRATVSGAGVTKDIRARGLVYNGTLLDPMKSADKLFVITNGSHKSGESIGSFPLVHAFPDDGRYTWGWSCNPCQLLLAYYMVARTDTWDGGGTPMRQATTLRSETHPMVFFTRTRWAARLSLYFAPMEESSEDRRARVRAEAQAEEGDYVPEPSRELNVHERHTRVLRQSLRENLQILPATTPEALRQHYERAQRTVLTDLAGRAWLPRSASEQRAAFSSAQHPSSARFDFQEAEASVTIDRATLLRTLSTTLTPVVLDGHCFTYVRVFPHAKLLDEAAITTPTERSEDADPSDGVYIDTAAPLVGAPTTSLIAAYNPLTGEPYATSAEGEIYLFEASGALSMIRAGSRGGPNAIFGPKTFVWTKMHGLHLKATSQAAGGWIVEIAEQTSPLPSAPPAHPGAAPTRAAGETPRAFQARRSDHRRHLATWLRSQPSYRPKDLVCFSTFEERDLRIKYAVPRVFEPVAFSRTGAELQGEDAEPGGASPPRTNRAGQPVRPREPSDVHRDIAFAFHSRRAVPFETLSEAQNDARIRRRYATPSQMRANASRAQRALEAWLASLPPNPPPTPGEERRRRPKTTRDRVEEALALLRGTRSSGGG